MRIRQKVYLRRNLIPVAWYLVTPIAIFFAVRALWGLESGSRLAQARRALVAEGLALDWRPAEQAGPPDQDPALALQRIASSITLAHDDRNLLVYGDGRDTQPISWTDAHKPRVLALLTELQPALARVDPALALKGAGPPQGMELYELRPLFTLLRDDATVSHEQGDDVRALHRLNELIAIAQIADRQPTPQGHGAATGVRDLTANALEHICLGLRLGGSDSAAAEAKLLLKDLSDLTEFEQAEVSEAKVQLARANELAASFNPELDSWWIRPLLEDQMRENLLAVHNEIAVAQADNYLAALFETSTAAERAAFFSRASSLLNEAVFHGSAAPLAVGSYRAAARFACICDSSATAVLLAAQIYKQRHGAYPGSAEQLTPELLPSVPTDPYSRDHRPLQYRLDPGGPTVWSVGDDGVDGRGIVGFNGRGLRTARDSQRDRIYGAAWEAAAPPPLPPPPTAPARIGGSATTRSSSP